MAKYGESMGAYIWRAQLGIPNPVEDTMTPERTNDDRAESAMRALVYYSQKAHGGESYQDYHLSDLLGDLRHLADSYGEDWDALLETANTHYIAEWEDELRARANMPGRGN